MADYRIILHIETAGPDDLDTAKAVFESDLHDAEFRDYNIELVDVQMLPRAGRNKTLERHMDHIQRGIDQSEQIMLETSDHMSTEPETGRFESPDEHVAFLPTMGVVHPWDQGSWIFPDDHPFAALERMAAAVTRDPNNRTAMQKELTEAKKAIEGEVVDED